MTNTLGPAGVFLALTFESRLYKSYPGASQDLRQKDIQNLIITLREDGYFGFLGGTMNDNETELETLARECMEEGNLDISLLHGIQRVCEHTLPDGFRVILYHASISKVDALYIISQSVFAEHYFTETSGLNSVALIPNSTFNRNNFLPCMREEFKEIAKIIKSDVLRDWGEVES